MDDNAKIGISSLRDTFREMPWELTLLVDVIGFLGLIVFFNFVVGVMNLLPNEMLENFNLVIADATIDQVLEVISGATGLEFVRVPEGIRVEASETLKEAASTPDSRRGRRRQRPPFFVRMSLPGPEDTTIEVFIRGDELPEDVVRKIQAEKEKLIEKLSAESGK